MHDESYGSYDAMKLWKKKFYRLILHQISTQNTKKTKECENE